MLMLLFRSVNLITPFFATAPHAFGCGRSIGHLSLGGANDLELISHDFTKRVKGCQEIDL